ncbi:MAG: threonine synthase [Clostridiales bacterium]|nr:threonine synthase [Clostridiales bacterium]
MRYLSTRDNTVKFRAARAIAQGLSREGGLFVPEAFPAISEEDIIRFTGMTYAELAVFVMKLYLDDYSEIEMTEYASQAYGKPGFDHPDVAPVRLIDDRTAILELWHGPTCAFKDMALQMLPHLLSAALDKTEEAKDVCILVATSGDTGKAALDGFRDVKRTKIMVFYPEDGVSDIQRLQMVTQEGGNVGVSAVTGNFDDAQSGVKAIFSDETLRAELDKKGYFLSSANSINWGRLLPQIVYYISAYCNIVKAGGIIPGEPINFCVPTGNFGNILAGYYAKKMGLPIGRLICASNSNDVLTEFIETGVYNKNRAFVTTISPSMDILISSNLERLLFDLSGNDDRLIAGYMKALADEGKYEVSQAIKAGLRENIDCGKCSDTKTKETIKEVFDTYRYLIDTHTAVAFNVLSDYRLRTGDTTKTIVVSTASPFKFCESVLSALGEQSGFGGLELIDRLEEVSGAAGPAPLKALRGKEVRFKGCVKNDGMRSAVESFLF